MQRKSVRILLVFCIMFIVLLGISSTSQASSKELEVSTPPTVKVEGVEVLADGEYYLQILGKWIYPIHTNAVWIELSDKKPDKPFKIQLQSYDKKLGPKYSITYNGIGVGVQSSNGQQLSSMYAPNWTIAVHQGFGTIRDYTDQSLIVNANGEKSDNGTKVIVWNSTGTTPEHAKISFFTPQNAPSGPKIPTLSEILAPKGKNATLPDGWYRLKMSGEGMSLDGYVDFDSSGNALLTDNGAMEIYEGSDRTDDQKFYLKNNDKGQISLRTVDGKYLGSSGDIKNGLQVKKVSKAYLWNVNFSKVELNSSTTVTYGALRPSGNKKFLVAGELSMSNSYFLTDQYTIVEGSKLWLQSSSKTVPVNGAFSFIPVSTPTNVEWYKAPKLATGGKTKTLTFGNMTLKISNVYSMGANINLVGKQDMAGYRMHVYFVIAEAPGTIKISYTGQEGYSEVLFWPMHSIKYADKNIPKPIYPERVYGVDFGDAEYLPFKKGTTTITNNTLYDISYSDGKAISGYRNGEYWNVQIFFMDKKTAQSSVGTAKKYSAGRGLNGGTYIVY